MANPLPGRRSRAVTTLVENTVLVELPILMPNGTFVVERVTMTTAEVEAVLKAHQVAYATVATTGSAYHAAVAAENALNMQARAVIAAVEISARATFGAASPQYASLGFTAKKRAAPTVETRLVGVVKAKATRAARGTGGKKQKAKIHGAPVTPDTTKR
jgi:hypothetical protein